MFRVQMGTFYVFVMMMIALIMTFVSSTQNGMDRQKDKNIFIISKPLIPSGVKNVRKEDKKLVNNINPSWLRLDRDENCFKRAMVDYSSR